MAKINFEKPVILYDDRARGAYAVVTKILYIDKKSAFVESQFVEDVNHEKNHVFLEKEKHRIMIDLVKNKNDVYGNYNFDEYIASNYSSFMEDYMKAKNIKAPKMLCSK